MANIETPPSYDHEDPANPPIASQDAFNKYIDKHVEHLFDGDNSYNYGDVRSMSDEERAIRRAGHRMPGFKEYQVVAGSGEARTEDADALADLKERFSQPAIKTHERNAGRRKTDAPELGRLAVTREQD